MASVARSLGRTVTASDKGTQLPARGGIRKVIGSGCCTRGNKTSEERGFLLFLTLPCRPSNHNRALTPRDEAIRNSRITIKLIIPQSNQESVCSIWVIPQPLPLHILSPLSFGHPLQTDTPRPVLSTTMTDPPDLELGYRPVEDRFRVCIVTGRISRR